MAGPRGNFNVAASLAPIDLGMTQGAAVLSLMERARVSPIPPLYKLLYDYVAGVEGLAGSRVHDILTEGDAGGAGAEARLYAEFVEPYRRPEKLSSAIARMVTRLTTLDLLIVDHSEATSEHSASLKAAEAHLGAEIPDLTLIREWVDRLQAANGRLAKTHEALVRELAEARLELDSTHSEIGRSRENQLRDPLTGLANRPGLDQQLTRALATGPLTCAVLDIDHFKSLNDSYGHQVGDEVLRIVARAILANARERDIVGRIGGDEFVVIFPATDALAAAALAERIREAIMASDLGNIFGRGVTGGITASIGVSPFRPGDSIVSLVNRADICLYEAKRQGRNRVVCEDDPLY